MYKPGNQVAYALPKNKKELMFLAPFGDRRALTIDEFSYYHSFLNEQDKRVGDETKAAIGTVLKADMIRLYNENNIKYEDIKDDLTDKWASKFKELEKEYSTKYGKALAEVHAFEKFLITPAFQLNNYQEIKEEISFMSYGRFVLSKAYKNIKEAVVQAEISRQEIEFDKKKSKDDEKKFLDNFTARGRNRYKAWVKNKIHEYLASIFSIHPLSKIPNYNLLSKERPSRNLIIDLVNKNKITGPQGAKAYKEILNALLESKSDSDFLKRRNKIISKFKTYHPIMRVL